MTAAAGPGSAGPGTSGPLLPAWLPAPGLGPQDSCDPSAFGAAGWGCARAPAAGIMGNGMTKVGGGPARPSPRRARWAALPAADLRRGASLRGSASFCL